MLCFIHSLCHFIVAIHIYICIVEMFNVCGLAFMVLICKMSSLRINIFQLHVTLKVVVESHCTSYVLITLEALPWCCRLCNSNYCDVRDGALSLNAYSSNKCPVKQAAYILKHSERKLGSVTIESMYSSFYEKRI